MLYFFLILLNSDPKGSAAAGHTEREEEFGAFTLYGTPGPPSIGRPAATRLKVREWWPRRLATCVNREECSHQLSRRVLGDRAFPNPCRHVIVQSYSGMSYHSYRGSILWHVPLFLQWTVILRHVAVLLCIWQSYSGMLPSILECSHTQACRRHSYRGVMLRHVPLIL